MADTFKPGDVVQLKSGGPQMCVVQQMPEIVGCEWHDGNKRRYAEFVATSLEHVQPSVPTVSNPTVPR